MLRLIVRLVVGLSLVACGEPKPEPIEPIGPHGPRVNGATRPAVYRDAKSGSGVELENRCHVATRKLMPLLVEVTKTHARPVVAKDLEVVSNDCVNFKYEAVMADPDVKCLFEAKDDAAVRACWAASLARPKDKAEGTRVLEQAARNATALVRRDGTLPRGDVFATPAIGCCARIGHRCRGGYEGSILADLGFGAEHKSYFQLAYKSDGSKLTVKAVGDLDCDGTTITYTLEGTAQGGELRYKIVEPTNPD